MSDGSCLGKHDYIYMHLGLQLLTTPQNAQLDFSYKLSNTHHRKSFCAIPFGRFIALTAEASLETHTSNAALSLLADPCLLCSGAILWIFLFFDEDLLANTDGCHICEA